MKKFIFLDTETTGLHRRQRKIWDLAYIIRDRAARPNDFERQFWMDVDLSEADSFALGIGGYYKRHPDPYGVTRAEVYRPNTGLLPNYRVAQEVARDFSGAVLVGAVPSFDEETLAGLLLDEGLTPTWNHHLIDVETLAAGALGLEFPWNLDTVMAALALEYPEEARHTAIGDARMVRDVYDAVQDRWHGQSNSLTPSPEADRRRGPVERLIPRPDDTAVMPCVTGDECDGSEPCSPLCNG